MKKIIITITTMAVALCANAKTIEELVVEVDNAIASNPNKFNALVYDDVYFANKADVEAMYGEWKSTNIARFSMVETDALKAERNALTATQRKQYAIKNALCARHIINNNLYEDAGRASLNVAAYRTAKYFAQHKPEWYDNLKNAGFVVDGVKLSELQILLIAVAFDDVQTVMSTPFPSNVQDVVVAYLTKTLLSYPDASIAYAKCEEVLGVLCLVGKTKTDAYIKLESVSKRLANRTIVKSVKK